MKRLKLPAYGKRLLDERRAGKHPLEVTLVYGDRWSKGKDPRVCISPKEYSPGQYDFCMLAGTRVLVLDQLNAGADWNGKFYDLLHELAIAGALAIVETPDGVRSSVLQLADRERKRSADGDTWPRWWSSALDQAHRSLLYDWLDDTRKAKHGRVAA